MGFSTNFSHFVVAIGKEFCAPTGERHIYTWQKQCEIVRDGEVRVGLVGKYCQI